jgi:hypothetical protein
VAGSRNMKSVQKKRRKFPSERKDDVLSISILAFQGKIFCTQSCNILSRVFHFLRNSSMTIGVNLKNVLRTKTNK